MEFKKEQSLKRFNTMGVEVSAKWMADIHSLNDLQEVIAWNQSHQEDILILGGGSNILFTKNFSGLVIHYLLKGIEIISENETEVFIRCSGGEVWHDLVMFSVNKNLGGLENLSLIPGSVGAAPIQNIGAYGVELKDTLVSLEAIDLKTGEVKSFSNSDCKFGYRNSVFKNEMKNQFLISSVTFKLKKNPTHFNTSYGAIETQLKEMDVETPTVKAVSDAVISIRQSKLPDPAVLGNTGSFFKNPEVEKNVYEQIKIHHPNVPGYPAGDKIKIAAGWLIEQCGFKGKRFGQTGMHALQSLVLVNYGNATGQDLYNTAKLVQQTVEEKFSVKLEMEVNIL